MPNAVEIRHLSKTFGSRKALDAVSLTVAEVGADAVAVWLIPHTLAVTNLHTRRVGDIVNVEFDVLGKYVERMLEARLGTARGDASDRA